MRGALLVLTLAVAACGDDHGVTVIIHPNATDVTQVRLYIGVGNETMTDLTDDTLKVANASYWTRDPGNELDLQTVVNHGDVIFNYDTSETIPVVIAVGYDAQGQPIAAGVADTLDPAPGRNDFQIYDITLAPADPFSQTSSAMQIGLWSPMTTDLVHASCAGIIDATKPHPYFVVLDNDQDCDGFIDGTDAECTPDVYHGTRGADSSQANCLYATAASTTASASCQLGGSPCKDNTPVTTVTCQASTTCLPTSLCAPGVCPATHPDDYECAADVVGSMVDLNTHAHYRCTVPTMANGMPCPNLELTLERPPTGGYDCTGFEIGDSMTALGNSIKQDHLTITAEQLAMGKSCAATVSITGTPTQVSQPIAGLVNFTLKNTGGIAIPIVFTFDNQGCAVATTCNLDEQTFDDPTQTRCAAGWQPPTAVTFAATTTSAEDPTLTDDQKTMFFVGQDNIYTSTKTMNGWSTPTSLALLTMDNRSPDVGGVGSANGTTLVYTAAEAVGGRQIYIATRLAVDTPFAVATALVDPTSLSSFTAATFAPSPQDGSSHLIAAGTVQGAPGLFDVTYSPAMSMITLITPIMIVNGPLNPDKPHLTPDGLHLYFEGTDVMAVSLYVASRATIDDPFTYAVELSELSMPTPGTYTGGAWVSPGGRTMYFTQQGAGGNRILTTTRANLP